MAYNSVTDELLAKILDVLLNGSSIASGRHQVAEVFNNEGRGTRITFSEPWTRDDAFTLHAECRDIEGRLVGCRITNVTKDGFTCIPDKDSYCTHDSFLKQ